MRERYYINRNWKFSDSFEGSLLIEPMKNGTIVELPHTFEYTPYNYIDKARMNVQCVYQRMLNIREEWQDKRIFLTFEGSAYRTSVYVNGVNLIIHESASAPFTVEIGTKIRFNEENLITVLVDSRSNITQPPFVKDNPVDVIPFCGIYREAYITITDKVSMENVFYRAETSLPPDTKGMNRDKLVEYRVPGTIKTNIELSRDAIKMAKEGRLSIRQFLNQDEISYQPLFAKGETVTSTGPVQLWDLDAPVCYRIQTDLLLDDVVIDTDVSMVGFRTAVFNQSGFYLNGRKVKIRGIVRQQIYPYAGYAMPESLQRLDARILKEELHVNAVRCCGEYPSEYFLDECDKRGILVLCETPGYRNLGGEDFKKAHLQNVEDMIKAGRNHPSIFLWGTRINGSPTSNIDREAVEIAHRLDPTRPTAGERIDLNANFYEDVYAYTDLSYSGKTAPLLSKAEVTSDMSKPYLVCGYLGESISVKPTDSAKRKISQIVRAAGVLDAQSFLDDVCGSFAISMCDHPTMAENTAEDGIAYHGVLDSFRNKKPVAGVFSSQNNMVPELSVYPPLSGDRERWEGFGEVYILTNMDSVRVYRDGTFVCEYFKEDSPFGHMRHGPLVMNDFLGDVFDDEDPNSEQVKRIKRLLNQMATGGISSFFVPGKIMDRLIARLVYKTDRRQLLRMYEKYVSRSHEYKFEGIKNGKVRISHTIKPDNGKYLKTDASALNLIERHGYDVIQIRITVNNGCGEVLSDFGEPIIINTHGPVEVIGPAIIPLRGGMAGAYIKSVGKEGEANVTVSCGNLTPAKIDLNIIRAPEEEI